MERLTKDEYGILLALVVAKRSEDIHTKVGSVAMSEDGRILATGYNGVARNMEFPEWMKTQEGRIKKAAFILHAENNLCSMLKKGECHTLYLTLAPCEACCRQIAAQEVKRVVFVKEHPNFLGYREILRFYNIEYSQINEKSLNNIKRQLSDILA